MSGSRGREGERGVKEMDERATERGRGAKEEEEESEVWAADVELLFFSQK